MLALPRRGRARKEKSVPAGSSRTGVLLDCAYMLGVGMHHRHCALVPLPPSLWCARPRQNAPCAAWLRGTHFGQATAPATRRPHRPAVLDAPRSTREGELESTKGGRSKMKGERWRRHGGDPVSDCVSAGDSLRGRISPASSSFHSCAGKGWDRPKNAGALAYAVLPGALLACWPIVPSSSMLRRLPVPRFRGEGGQRALAPVQWLQRASWRCAATGPSCAAPPTHTARQPTGTPAGFTRVGS